MGVKYLFAPFSSFELHSYVQCAKELVFSNTTHHLKHFDIIFKTTLYMLSSDIAFNGYRRVTKEFNDSELCSILKFFFVKGKSATETFCDINTVLEGGTVPLKIVEEWFRRFRDGENETINNPAGQRLVMTSTKLIFVTRNSVGRFFDGSNALNVYNAWWDKAKIYWIDWKACQTIGSYPFRFQMFTASTMWSW